MKTTKRILSIALVAIMLFALLPLSALAAGAVPYTEVDYSTEITLGETVTYSVLETDPYIEPDWWGYAKGYTVELEAGKEYTFALAGNNLCGDYYIDRAFALMPEALSGTFSDDTLVIESTSDYYGSISLRTTFTVETSGKYKVLLWGYIWDENYSDVFGEENNSFRFLIGEPSEIPPAIVDIETTEDMKKFHDDYINGVYMVGDIELNILADIDMSEAEWTALEVEEKLVINGNNRYIKGLKAPLFSDLTSLEMYDLGIDVDIDFDDNESDYTYMAPICGYVENAKISNCHTTGTMDINANYVESVSGFIGDVYYAEIENSSSSVDITITAADYACYIGGFITFISSEATFKNCHYSGDITINDTTGGSYNIGGFAGYLAYARLENCSAKGNISVLTEIESTYRGCTGGFIGYSHYNDFINCCFEGDVIAPKYPDIGGFVGYSSSYGTYKNCFATGNVEGFESVGGFAGYAEYDNIFVNAYTTANVKGDNRTGGFTGYDAGYNTGNIYQNCYASGTVTTDDTEASKVAGFIGYLGSDATFENCYAVGDELPLVVGSDGVSLDTAGVSALDFTNESDVAEAVDAFNTFVTDAVDPELLTWKTVPDSTPTFGFPEVEAPQKPCNHTYDGIWDDSDDEYHWELCENEDCPYADEHYNETEHDFETVSDTAGCENDGILTQKCKDCEHTVETDSYAKGHIDENGDSVCDACGYSEYILGDVDNDGDVDADDYILLKRVYFGTAKLEKLDTPETALARSDVYNADGEITGDDYILLKRVYFGTAKIK